MPRPRLRIAENAHTSARRAHPIGYDGLFQIDCSALLLQPVPEKVVASARMSRMRSNRRLSASECNGSVSQEVRIPPPRLRVLAQFRFQMQKFESSRPNQPVRKKVEMRFAHLKTHHRFERMRLRGLSGARDEFHLAAVVQNLKTLANRMHQPTSLGSCHHHNPGASSIPSPSGAPIKNASTSCLPITYARPRSGGRGILMRLKAPRLRQAW
jgi:Transposase DDE domain